MSPIIYRILTAIPLIFGVSFLSFLIMHIAPGDPTLMYMDPTVSRSDLAQVRQNLGLDQPLLIQYVLWLKQLLQKPRVLLCHWKTCASSHSGTIASHTIVVCFVVDHNTVDYFSSWPSVWL